jgi:membrane protease YdiL (CAAX protease family)
MGFGVAILIALALGWLLTAAGLAELPPDVGSWALRLGGIAASISLAWGAFRYSQGITIRRKP